MLIAPVATLRAVQEAIVRAAHGLVDQNGEPVTLGTIDERRLAMAALNAIQAAAGDVVWPGDRTIDLPRPVRPMGIFARAAE